jgi:hypothetical protein
MTGHNKITNNHFLTITMQNVQGKISFVNVIQCIEVLQVGHFLDTR